MWRAWLAPYAQAVYAKTCTSPWIRRWANPCRAGVACLDTVDGERSSSESHSYGRHPGDVMKVCVPVDHDGNVDPRWGRASRVAVADVADGAVQDWREYDVNWDTLHDEGTEGAHHARIARFLRDHAVEAVVVAHVGPGMQRMLDTMNIHVTGGCAGDARQAVVSKP